MEAKEYLKSIGITNPNPINYDIITGDGVFIHVEQLLTDFANSNDKIKVESDGVTVAEWIDCTEAGCNNESQNFCDCNDYDEDEYAELESITIQEHNKRLIELTKKDSEQILDFYGQIIKANETITTYKKAIKVAGYLFNGRFYKSLDELKGKTMSKENQPKPLYF